MRRSSRSSAGGRALVRVVTSTAGFMSTAFLAFVAFGGLLAAVGARAEVATIDVLLDLDRNPATGCAVTTIDGAAEGVDLRVRTLFDVGTETVTSASTATCADPMLDVFGGESAIASVPLPTWTGALGNGVKGSMLIESHVPLSLTGVAPRARAFVVLSSLVGEDALLVSESGASLLVALRAPPVPSAGAFALAGLLLGAFAVGRRELRSRAVVVGLAGSIVVASLLAPARGWALLGEGIQRIWNLEERLGTDPEADAPAGVDLLDFYAVVDAAAGELWLRTDVLFGAPICNGWGRVDPGVGFVCTMQPPLDNGPFGGAVALTFDDGPNLTVTPRVLATLRANGIPATFFMRGDRLTTPAEQALALEIHEDPLFRVANHSFSHTNFTLLTPEQIDDELETTSDLIRAAIGDPCYFPRYFRFPYAASDCTAMAGVRSHGLGVAAVNIEPADWCYGTGGGVCPSVWIPEEFHADLPGYAVNRFLAAGGGIMLMHDIHTNTADLLPDILAALQAAGATFVDLEDPILFPIMNQSIVEPEAPACCEGATN